MERHANDGDNSRQIKKVEKWVRRWTAGTKNMRYYKRLVKALQLLTIFICVKTHFLISQSWHIFLLFVRHSYTRLTRAKFIFSVLTLWDWLLDSTYGVFSQNIASDVYLNWQIEGGRTGGWYAWNWNWVLWGKMECLIILYLTLLISLWKQLHRLVWSAPRLWCLTNRNFCLQKIKKCVEGITFVIDSKFTVCKIIYKLSCFMAVLMRWSCQNKRWHFFSSLDNVLRHNFKTSG